MLNDIKMKIVCYRKPNKKEIEAYNLNDPTVTKIKINHTYEAEKFLHFDGEEDYVIGLYIYPKGMFKTEFEYQLEDIINGKE